MPTFEYILVLLSAVFISNLISRLLPALSVPIIQIILGACISFLPLGIAIELEPGLFFVLFIAPLIFNAGMLLDKKTFWVLRGPILNMAVVLVIISIIAIAGFLHLLAPDIPLVAAFALIAALGPTDDVAIITVSQKVPIPPKLMNLINDASGIVSFQLAMLAAVSGAFSPAYAAGRLLIAGIGGISAGLVLIYLKILLVRWLRRLGMEHVTLHILLELLAPFIIYMVAENIGVSGVLAVFAAGAAHSFRRDKLNPETASLNVASKSIWNVLSFTLEGVVYLILGIQLPRILRTIGSGP